MSHKYPSEQAFSCAVALLILLLGTVVAADAPPSTGVRVRSLLIKEFDLPPQLAIAFSQDGKYIASGGRRGGYIWNSTTLTRVQTIAIDRFAQSVVFDAESKYLFLQSDEDSRDRKTSIFWCEVGKQARSHRWTGSEASFESVPINGTLCAVGRREILLVTPQHNESKTVHVYAESEIPIRCIRPIDDIFVWISKKGDVTGAWLQRLNAGGELLHEIKLNAQPKNVDLLDSCGNVIIVCGDEEDKEEKCFVDVFDSTNLQLRHRISLTDCYRLQGSTAISDRLFCVVAEGPHRGDTERSACDGSIIVVDVQTGKVLLKEWLQDSVEKVAYCMRTKTLVTLQGAPSNGADFRLHTWKVELE